MSDLVKRINLFFKSAIKSDIDRIKEEIVLSERQEKIFRFFYLDRQNIGYIADTLNVCPMVINNELKVIRIKLERILWK